jgi:hypothetical protein
MPEQSLATLISNGAGEAAKLVVGAIGVWAYKTAKTLGTLDPRVKALESMALAAEDYARGTLVEERFAEAGAAHRAAVDVEREARFALEGLVRELQRQVARLEGRAGVVTPVAGAATLGGAPIADRRSHDD